jgi:EAL domain-containing protein (putative c-di-GMP-specific phosphodiesterase class I)
MQVHVNMAAPEFLDDDLPHELMAIVNAAGVDPSLICLELTEGVIMRRIEKTLPIMRELVRLGFEISLDDFGMGYSSLSLLKTLPISSIKIDRVFLQGVPHQRNDCAIVRTIIDLGLNMQLRIIAEGVESGAVGLPAPVRLHASAGLPVGPSDGTGWIAGAPRRGVGKLDSAAPRPGAR